MVAPDFFNRRNRLVSEEAVRIVEGGDQGIHRPLRAELRQRGGNVTTDPHVLALVAQRMGQGSDDLLAVTHECVAGVRFQRPMPEQ